jgi:hypothetical protein
MGTGTGDDTHGLAGRDLTVHPGRGDPDALLAPLLLEPVELGAVEQLAEDLGHLLAHDAGPVVLDRDAVAVFADLCDLDFQVGENARLLAGVEGVVDRLLHGREKGFLRVVEAEQMTVLGEELGDGDVALAGRHAPGVLAAGLAPPWRRGRGLLGRALLPAFGLGGGLLTGVRARSAGGRSGGSEQLGLESGSTQRRGFLHPGQAPRSPRGARGRAF